MGPDCGTSLIGGVGIGFANAVRKGSIGVIGAAGTGLQEFTSQVHNAGFGISHAIGTGSHDLSEKVGGLTTFAALDALEADPHTQRHRYRFQTAFHLHPQSLTGPDRSIQKTSRWLLPWRKRGLFSRKNESPICPYD